MKFNEIPDKKIIDKTIQALKNNGFDAEFIENKNLVKQKILDLIPKGSEVMTMTSVTLDELEIPKVLQESDQFDLVRDKLNKMNREKDGLEMNKLGAAAEYVLGSVHAVTEDGKIVVVSNSGSQLPAYSYGSQHVIWVVGAQKIVKDLNEAMDRVENYVLPLESNRAQKAYGVERSYINKVLVFHKEPKVGRIKILLINDTLGF